MWVALGRDGYGDLRYSVTGGTGKDLYVLKKILSRYTNRESLTDQRWKLAKFLHRHPLEDIVYDYLDNTIFAPDTYYGSVYNIWFNRIRIIPEIEKSQNNINWNF